MMTVDVKTIIMNRESPPQKPVTPDMYVLISAVWNALEFFLKNSIGGIPGKKNLFLFFCNGPEDIQVYPLCATQGIAIQKKEKTISRFFSKKRQRKQKNQGWEISDLKKYPKEFYFRDIMHEWV
jgi:hypothetical protein